MRILIAILLFSFGANAQTFMLPIPPCKVVSGGCLFATYDPSNKSPNITLSTDLQTETASTTGMVAATKKITAGTKLYWEVTVGSGPTTIGIGICLTSAMVLSNYVGQTSAAWGLWSFGLFTNGATVGSGYTGYTTGDVISMAVDGSGNMLQFDKNGATDGTAVAITHGDYYPVTGGFSTISSTTINFGCSAWDSRTATLRATLLAAGYQIGF